MARSTRSFRKIGMSAVEEILKYRPNSKSKILEFTGETKPQQRYEEHEIIIMSGFSRITRCKYFTYCGSGLLALLFCTALLGTIFPYPIHASCIIKWKFGDPCDPVMQKFRCQILNWSSWQNCGTNGRKCLYTIQEPRANENNVIKAEHLSNLRSSDRIKIVFEDTNGTCLATGESVSNDLFVFFDHGGNYCNLRNLVVGIGFDKDPRFLELTSNEVCTQYNMATCG